jgi:hypothetical protein
MSRVLLRNLAAVLGGFVIAYEPLAAVVRWDRLPRWIYPARMAPFFIGVLLLGTLLASSRAKAAWSVAIGAARVAFHDSAVRAGVFGDRSPWLAIHEFQPPSQYMWLLIAVAIHAAVYFGFMVVAAAIRRRWEPSVQQSPGRGRSAV